MLSLLLFFILLIFIAFISLQCFLYLLRLYLEKCKGLHIESIGLFSLRSIRYTVVKSYPPSNTQSRDSSSITTKSSQVHAILKIDSIHLSFRKSSSLALTWSTECSPSSQDASCPTCFPRNKAVSMASSLNCEATTNASSSNRSTTHSCYFSIFPSFLPLTLCIEKPSLNVTTFTDGSDEHDAFHSFVDTTGSPAPSPTSAIRPSRNPPSILTWFLMSQLKFFCIHVLVYALAEYFHLAIFNCTFTFTTLPLDSLKSSGPSISGSASNSNLTLSWDGFLVTGQALMPATVHEQDYRVQLQLILSPTRSHFSNVNEHFLTMTQSTELSIQFFVSRSNVALHHPKVQLNISELRLESLHLLHSLLRHLLPLLPRDPSNLPHEGTPEFGEKEIAKSTFRENSLFPADISVSCQTLSFSFDIHPPNAPSPIPFVFKTHSIHLHASSASQFSSFLFHFDLNWEGAQSIHFTTLNTQLLCGQDKFFQCPEFCTDLQFSNDLANLKPKLRVLARLAHTETTMNIPSMDHPFVLFLKEYEISRPSKPSPPPLIRSPSGSPLMDTSFFMPKVFQEIDFKGTFNIYSCKLRPTHPHLTLLPEASLEDFKVMLDVTHITKESANTMFEIEFASLGIRWAPELKFNLHGFGAKHNMCFLQGQPHPKDPSSTHFQLGNVVLEVIPGEAFMHIIERSSPTTAPKAPASNAPTPSPLILLSNLFPTWDFQLILSSLKVVLHDPLDRLGPLVGTLDGLEIQCSLEQRRFKFDIGIDLCQCYTQRLSQRANYLFKTSDIKLKFKVMQLLLKEAHILMDHEVCVTIDAPHACLLQRILATLKREPRESEAHTFSRPFFHPSLQISVRRLICNLVLPKNVKLCISLPLWMAIQSNDVSIKSEHILFSATKARVEKTLSNTCGATFLGSPFFTLMEWRHVELNLSSMIDFHVSFCQLTVPFTYAFQDVLENGLLFLKLMKHDKVKDNSPPLKKSLKVSIDTFRFLLEDDPFESKLNQLFKFGREAQLARLQRESALTLRLNAVKLDALPFWQSLYEYHSMEWIKCVNSVKLGETLPLFSMDLLHLNLLLVPENREGFGICHNLDPKTPETADFDFFQATQFSMRFKQWNIRLRDYPFPLFDIPLGEHHIHGLLVLAEPMPTDTSMMEVEVLPELPPIRKTSSPVKIYQSLTCELSKGVTFNWGPAVEPCVTFINKIFDQFTNKSADPSPPLPWWDKLRYLCHGPFRLKGEWIRFHLLGSRNPYYSLITQDGSHGFIIEAKGNAELIVAETFIIMGEQVSVFNERPWLTKSGLETNYDRDVYIKFIGNVSLDFDIQCRPNAVSHHLIMPVAPNHFVQDSYKDFRSLAPTVTLTLQSNASSGFNELTCSPRSIQNFIDMFVFQVQYRTVPIRQGALFAESINAPNTVKLSRILAQCRLFVDIRKMCITLWHTDRAMLELDNGVGVRAIVERCKIQFQCLRVNKQLDWKVDTTDIGFHGIEIRAVYLSNQCENMDTNAYSNFEREEKIFLRFAEQFVALQVNSHPFLWAPQIFYCRRSDLGTPSSFGRDVQQVQLKLLETQSNPQYRDSSEVKNLLSGRTYNIDQDDYLHAFVIHNPRMVWNTQVRDRLFRLVILHQQTFLIQNYLSYTLLRFLDSMENHVSTSSSASTTTSTAATPPPLSTTTTTNSPGRSPTKARNTVDQMRHLLVQFIHPQFKLVHEFDGIVPDGCCIITTEHMSLTQEYILRDDKYEVKTITIADIKDANILVTAQLPSAHHCQLVAPYLSSDAPEWVPLEFVILGKVPTGYTQVSNKVCIKLQNVKHNPLHYQHQEDESLDDRLAFEFSPFVLHSDPLVYSLLSGLTSNLVVYKEPSSNRQKELLDAILFTTEEKDKEKLVQTILSLRSDIRQLTLGLQYDLSVFQLDIEESTAKWSDMLSQLHEHMDTLLVFMRAYQGLHRKAPSNGVTSQTQFFASHLIWNMLLLDEQLPFAQWRLSTFCFKLMDFEDDARTFDLTVEHFMGLNLLPTPIFKEVANRYGSGDTDMLRVYWHALAPVAGIAVVTLFEVSFCPIKLQITYEFGKQLMNFLFPLRNSTLTPSGSITNLAQDGSGSSISVPVPSVGASSQSPAKSDLVKRRRLKSRLVSSESNDALHQMKSRASQNTTFILIKIPSVQHCVSYRGTKEKNIEDVHDFVLTSPNLEYRNKTWTWLEFLMQVRRDFFFAILSHTGQLVKEKLFSNKRSMTTLSDIADDPPLVRTDTLSSAKAKSTRTGLSIRDFRLRKSSSKDDCDTETI